MSKLSLQQIDFLIDSLRDTKGLDMFNLEDWKMMWDRLAVISQGQKSLLFYLMVKGPIEKLINILDQFGIERKSNV